MRKNNYSFLILLAVTGGIFLSITYVNPYNGVITLSELVLQLSGSRGDLELGFSMSELMSFAMRILPECIFEAYMGIMLYRHFCTASIYIFSRCTNRSKWYWSEMISLGIGVLSFQAVLLIVTVITTLLRYQVEIYWSGILLSIYHLFIRFLWVYLLVICINLLAIRIGSNQSFAVAMMMQAMCIAVLGMGFIWKNR